MGGLAIDLFDLAGDDLEDLVDQMHAPVEDHPAAVLLFAAPVARDPARAVDARLEVDRLADLAGLDDLLDREKVDVPAAVLVNGEEFARFALLFRFDGDKKQIRHVIYNCTVSRPKIESKTNEESKEVQTETLNITARPLRMGLVKAKTGNGTAPNTYDNWFKSVYVSGKSTTQKTGG